MISITFTGETPLDIERQMQAWLGVPQRGKSVEASKVREGVADGEAKSSLSSSGKTQSIEPLVAPVADPIPVAAPAEPAEDPPAPTEQSPPDYAVVRDHVLKLAVVKSPEAVRALLSGYGVTKASDLDPSRWNALLIDVKAAMA